MTLPNVGAVVSSVTEVWSVVVVFGEPLLPALSSTEMLKDALTDAFAATVPVAVHSVLASLPVRVTPLSPLIVTSFAVGVWIGSPVVNESVTSSPALARVVSTLSEAM